MAVSNRTPTGDMRGTSFRNESGETVPAFAVMRVTGSVVLKGRVFLRIGKPNGDGRKWNHVINGPQPVDNNKLGTCFDDFPCAADGSTNIAAGKQCGPTAGSWLLQDGGDGFRSYGVLSIPDNRMLVTRDDDTFHIARIQSVTDSTSSSGSGACMLKVFAIKFVNATFVKQAGERVLTTETLIDETFYAAAPDELKSKLKPGHVVAVHWDNDRWWILSLYGCPSSSSSSTTSSPSSEDTSAGAQESSSSSSTESSVSSESSASSAASSASSDAASSSSAESSAAPSSSSVTSSGDSSSAAASSSSDTSSSASSTPGPSSQSGPSSSSKDTAIVPASWSPTGYTALFVSEMPEVRFDDVMRVVVRKTEWQVTIDPMFREVCEPHSIDICGCVPHRPVPIGAVVRDGTVVIYVDAKPQQLPLMVTLRLTGVRRGFCGQRFPDRTHEQFVANEAFIQSAYPGAGH